MCHRGEQVRKRCKPGEVGQYFVVRSLKAGEVGLVVDSAAGDGAGRFGGLLWRGGHV